MCRIPHTLRMNQSNIIALSGQEAAQHPHSRQMLLSMVMTPSFSEMAPTGQISLQE
jgi:hypothetical protein